jgi:hypothetical protein
MRAVFRQTLIGFVVCLLLVSTFILSSVSSARAATGFGFDNFELGDYLAPGSPGTVCPQSTQNPACTNIAGEPAIRADNAGNFYASSEHGLGGGTDAWKSSDGGKHYTTLVSPDAGSASNTTGFAPGGGDTDLAVAPVKNTHGLYNVYVASLTLANIDVSTSMDGGKTFTLNPIGATIAGDDREWIAADGSSKVCLSYHDVATFNIDVNCSMDAGLTFTQFGDAIDANHLFDIDNNEIGNMMIDPTTHYIYQTFSGIANASEELCSSQGTCGYHVVYMAVSKDGGKTFTDHVVYNNPTITTSYGHQFVNVSIDKAGNVYSVYCDNHNIYYSYSTNHGSTWSAPVKVNEPNWGANTAIFPWSVANGAGHLDIVWYGTSYYDGKNPPDTYPLSAVWHVDFAQNLHATTPGTSFTQVAAGPIVHHGGVCEGGISCTGNSSQNRDLFDDFGVAVNPNTGYASIVYSDDQYTNTVKSPPQSGCTPTTSNTRSCEHTSIATQTSGTGI